MSEGWNKAIDTTIKRWKRDGGKVIIDGEDKEKVLSREEFNERYLKVTSDEAVHEDIELLHLIKAQTSTHGGKIRLTRALREILDDDQKHRLRETLYEEEG